MPSLREGIGGEITLWPEVRCSGLLPTSSFLEPLPACLRAASALHWPGTGDGEQLGYMEDCFRLCPHWLPPHCLHSCCPGVFHVASFIMVTGVEILLPHVVCCTPRDLLSTRLAVFEVLKLHGGPCGTLYGLEEEEEEEESSINSY